MDRLINWIVSQTHCSETKINMKVERFSDWGSSFFHNLPCTMYPVINGGSSFFHSLPRTMDPIINGASSFFHSLPRTMDPVINGGSSFFHSLQLTKDPVSNGFMSMIRNLTTKFNGDSLLRVGGAVGVVVAAIVVVPLLWTFISAVVWLLWKVTCAVVSLPSKVISGGVRFLWKVIKTIFHCGGKGGKTMKAPGRNIRIFRNDFERSPKSYFRDLHKK